VRASCEEDKGIIRLGDHDGWYLQASTEQSHMRSRITKFALLFQNKRNKYEAVVLPLSRRSVDGSLVMFENVTGCGR
jgi:hypothetical protein